jgi:hypothetical protein
MTTCMKQKRFAARIFLCERLSHGIFRCLGTDPDRSKRSVSTIRCRRRFLVRLVRESSARAQSLACALTSGRLLSHQARRRPGARFRMEKQIP